ncbi:hypothetical protein [Schumannella sp. 10F1B-5-1]|uniref:hypothetical protein n=1 Tax=Schumannella sp. 10F1B-5-1 TaxID=2590780 RepID=UPI001132070A|nr:hypothetical protein [Schumannella sp. 10F1B-5-1]TPW73640.1 hypothetical protein FJ658_05525 [Schumannella sp. 10F1B-5-1]
MKIKKIAAAAAVAAVAVAGSALVAPAFAEPVSNSYVLVGSDTLQDSANALINGTNVTGATVRVTAANKTLGSFDAFGTSMIQTKPGGTYFGRPSGSGQGVNALIASVNSAKWTPSAALPERNLGGQVDIARSSSGPGSNASSSGKLLYVPFARDAVGYAYRGGTAAWASLSKDQLTQIFNGTLKSVDGVAINPRLPQNGSGTRSFFLGAIGVASPSDTDNKTAENDASVLAVGDIIPFSAASWIAQANGVTPLDTTTAAGVNFGSAYTTTPTPAFTGTAPSLAPSSAYYSNTTFGRDTYLVVERARVTSGNAKYDAVLANLLDPSNTTGLANFSSLPTSSGAVKQKFGFQAPSTTVPSPAYPNI